MSSTWCVGDNRYDYCVFVSRCDIDNTSDQIEWCTKQLGPSILGAEKFNTRWFWSFHDNGTTAFYFVDKDISIEFTLRFG